MNGCGGRTGSNHGVKQAFPEVLVPWAQDPAGCKARGFPSPLPLGQGEKNRFCCNDGNVEEPLSAQNGGVSAYSEVPGAAGRRTQVLVVVAVLVALMLALAAPVAVLSARTCGGDPAVPVSPVLACPDGWVGYRNVCYYLSREEGSWEWSQEQCSSRGASLAVLRREWEMWLLLHLKGKMNPWIGLRRRGERLEWVDGSSFNQTRVPLGARAMGRPSCGGMGRVLVGGVCWGCPLQAALVSSWCLRGPPWPPWSQWCLLCLLQVWGARPCRVCVFV